jgi:hypothetical protein
MHVSINIDVNRPNLRASRRRVLVALVAVALALPAAAYASHQFTDVPDGHTFHGDIGKAKGAGLTAGCTPSSFCPDANVSRGQMTAFLNRGLGRIARSDISASITSGTQQTGGTVTLRAGNPSGGTQIIYLIASVHATTTAAGCPCELALNIRTSGGAGLGGVHYLDVPAPPAGDAISDENATVQAMIVVPTGVQQTFNFTIAQVYGTNVDIDIAGEFNALAVPFDGLGGNPVLPLSTVDEPAPARR